MTDKKIAPARTRANDHHLANVNLSLAYTDSAGKAKRMRAGRAHFVATKVTPKGFVACSTLQIYGWKTGNIGDLPPQYIWQHLARLAAQSNDRLFIEILPDGQPPLQSIRLEDMEAWEASFDGENK